MIIPEDNAEDVLSKALRGYGVSRALLPSRKADPQGFDHFLEHTLHLNVRAWHHLDHYRPSVTLPPEIAQHSFPFYEGVVNLWTIRTKDGFFLVDTGCSPDQAESVYQSMLAYFPEKTHPLLGILLTHEHFDHAGGLEAFPQAPVFHRVEQSEELRALSGLDFQILPILGHTPDSVCFYAEGGSSPWLFSGDALFAGSAGRAQYPREHAEMMARLETLLAPLPADTMIFPGHGPATQLKDEWKSNPFLLR